MLISLLYVIVALVIVGAMLYIVSLLPIDATIKKIINILVILVIGIWVIVWLVVPLLGHLPAGPLTR